MDPSRRSIAIGAAALIVFALAASSPSATRGAIDDPAIADALRFRASFGFSTDRALVERLVGEASGTAYGLPVTPAEETNLKVRADVRERLTGALAFIRSHPDDFGGAYFDQSVGRLGLVVRPTDSASKGSLDELATLVPVDADVRFIPADRSRTDLQRIRDDVVPREFPAAKGSYIDPVSNQVVVRLPIGVDGSSAIDVRLCLNSACS